MIAAIFLVGAMLFGMALVRRAFGARLNHAEQALWGLVVGWTLATAATYGLARLFGHLSFDVVLTILIATWLGAIFLWLPTIKEPRELSIASAALAQRLPAAPRCCFASLRLSTSRFSALTCSNPERMAVSTRAERARFTTWRFMPRSPTPSSTAGTFLPSTRRCRPRRSSIRSSPISRRPALSCSAWTFTLLWSSTAVPLALALTGIFYFFALRLLAFSNGAGIKRAPRLAASLATILFLLNGGLGFIYFFRDWRGSGKSFAALLLGAGNQLRQPRRERHSLDEHHRRRLLPQRTSLFGIPLALMIFTLFAIFWRESSSASGQSPTPGDCSLAPVCSRDCFPLSTSTLTAAVGLVSGILFHHATAPRLARILAAGRAPRAAAIGATCQPCCQLSGFAHFQIGWRGHNEPNWLLFWLRNVGLPTLLIIPAWFYAPRPLRLFLPRLPRPAPLQPRSSSSRLTTTTTSSSCTIGTRRPAFSWPAGWWAWPRRSAGKFLSSSRSSFRSPRALLALVYELRSKSLMFSRDEVAAAAFVREKPRRVRSFSPRRAFTSQS